MKVEFRDKHAALGDKIRMLSSDCYINPKMPKGAEEWHQKVADYWEEVLTEIQASDADPTLFSSKRRVR